MSIVSVNPANGEKIKEYNTLSLPEVSEKVKAVHTAWQTWKQSKPEIRSQLLQKMAVVL